MRVANAGGVYRPPTIGILCHFEQKRDLQMGTGALVDYAEAVAAAKGQPATIEMCDTPPEELLKNVDALLIPGGADVHPSFYNQLPRNLGSTNFKAFDKFELDVLKYALSTNMPIFGICRGQQLMNVAAGGDLIQDINKETDRARQGLPIIEHQNKKIPEMANDACSPIHGVRFTDVDGIRPSILQKLFGRTPVNVNSAHHQAIRNLGPIFAVTAWAMDNTVEAIERKDNPTQWAVQWHPERQRQVDPKYTKVFEKLVRDAYTWRNGAPPPSPQTTAPSTAPPPPTVAVGPAVPEGPSPWAPLIAEFFPGLSD